MRALMTARDGGSRDGAKERAETRAASIMCTRRSFDWPGEQARSDIIKKKKWTPRAAAISRRELRQAGGGGGAGITAESRKSRRRAPNAQRLEVGAARGRREPEREGRIKR